MPLPNAVLHSTIGSLFEFNLSQPSFAAGHNFERGEPAELRACAQGREARAVSGWRGGIAAACLALDTRLSRRIIASLALAVARRRQKSIGLWSNTAAVHGPAIMLPRAQASG
jgi:hypothetical protein